MSERLSQSSHEFQPRPVTGLFRLNMRGVPLEFSTVGKALPAQGEPRFAVKDVDVLRTTEGWAEFAEKLAARLEGIDSELHQGMSVYATAESPMDRLTDGMSPGEIRLISPEEYAEAYIEKYGNEIQGPMFW